MTGLIVILVRESPHQLRTLVQQHESLTLFHPADGTEHSLLGDHGGVEVGVERPRGRA